MQPNLFYFESHYTSWEVTLTFTEFLHALSQTSSKPRENTFLGIIRRPYEEVFVSRILAYLLQPQNCGSPVVLNAFCKLFCNEEVKNSDLVQVYTEQPAYSGRIDLLIEVEHKFIIVVENKINSPEHAAEEGHMQTDLYRLYCESYYKHYPKRYYVYLKPEYNLDAATCREFQTVNYARLAEAIREAVGELQRTASEQDTKSARNTRFCAIAEDFTQHCEVYFVSNIQISENDILYLNYLDLIEEVKNSYEAKMRNIKNAVRNLLEQTFSIENYADDDRQVLTWEITNDKTFYKIYRRNDWYLRRNYYLYTEVIYRKNKINDIECQIVLKGYDDYKKSASLFQKQVARLSNAGYETIAIYGQYYILKRKSFTNCLDLNRLKDAIVPTVGKFLTDCEVIASILREN